MFSHVLASVCFACALALTYLVAIVGPSPWWSPRYLIPMAGILLNNTLSGVRGCREARCEYGFAGKGGMQRVTRLAFPLHAKRAPFS